MAIERTQVIDIDNGDVLPPIQPSGKLTPRSVSFVLPELPEGDWHLRAITSITGLEIPASSFTLDVETKSIQAEFANPYEMPLEITAYAIDVVDPDS